MNRILKKESLNETVVRMVIDAPMIAKKAEPGQFVIIRSHSDSERIPLTISDYKRIEGTITIIFQIVGKGTMRLNQLNVDDFVCDLVGPLGNASKLNGLKKVIIVGGGVGCAIAYPVAKKLYESGAVVHSIIGFRNKDLVILENEFKEKSHKLITLTDDGSYKRKGRVTDALAELLAESNDYDEVMIIGPLMMMKYASLLVKEKNVKVTVSMNPIMIDGTGMCGGCRLTVGGKMKFACIDGPDFDGALVDFDEVMERNKLYLEFEKERKEECNLLKLGDKHE